MYHIFIILTLSVLTKMSYGNVQYCIRDNKGLNKCHDGGCNYVEPKTNIEKCVCTFSVGVMNGKLCGHYDDTCLKNPCKNKGICTSGIGHHICECDENFHGMNCELFIGIFDMHKV